MKGNVWIMVKILLPQSSLTGRLFCGGRRIGKRVGRRIVAHFLLLGDILLVSLQYGIFQLLSCLRGDGMGDIPEGTVFIFAAGHCNKQAFRSLDDFDIMYSKVLVHSDGNQCAQAVVRIGFSDSDIGDIHKCSPFV